MYCITLLDNSNGPKVTNNIFIDQNIHLDGK